MRLWSLHPKYLDRQGLLAVWREGLLAQAVLIKGENSTCPECNGNKRYQHSDLNMVKCLKCKETGKVKTAYYNHPAILRFKNSDNPIGFIGAYLIQIAKEGYLRGYNFKEEKIFRPLINKQLTVTRGQIEYEFEHLCKKLFVRNKEWLSKVHKMKDFRGVNYPYNVCGIEVNPLFKIIDGDVETWEKR